jgi:hypothetical protein
VWTCALHFLTSSWCRVEPRKHFEARVHKCAAASTAPSLSRFPSACRRVVVVVSQVVPLDDCVHLFGFFLHCFKLLSSSDCVVRTVWNPAKMSKAHAAKSPVSRFAVRAFAVASDTHHPLHLTLEGLDKSRHSAWETANRSSLRRCGERINDEVYVEFGRCALCQRSRALSVCFPICWFRLGWFWLRHMRASKHACANDISLCLSSLYRSLSSPLSFLSPACRKGLCCNFFIPFFPLSTVSDKPQTSNPHAEWDHRA